MGKFTIKTCLMALACLLPLSGFAAGLGKVTVLSALGQTLRAEIEIVSLQPGEAESLTARMASPQAFREAGIEINASMLSVRFTTERRPDGRHVVVMTSTTPINEPFLDFLVELSSASGRLVREYTFLLDPPEYKGPQAAPAVVAPVAPPVSRPLPAEAPKAPEMRAASPIDQKLLAQAAPAPAKNAGTYEVKRGDTLAKIAGTTKPDGVTLQQMLIALYRGNKDAFEGDNINRLRAGRILNVPDKEAAAAIDQKDAQRLVASQGQDFSEYRRKLGSAVAEAPAKGGKSGQTSGGKITPQTEDKPAPAKDQKDQLRLSRADAGKAGGRAAEDLVAKDKALKEANERVSDLEKNVKELQKALELANKTMADLQKQAQAKPGVAPATAAPAAVAKADAPKADAPKADAPKAEAPKAEAPKADAAKLAADAGKAAAEAPKAADAAKVADASKPGEAAKADAPKAADAPKPAAPKAAPKAPPPPPPPPPKGFVEELLDDPIMAGGAGAVVVGLLGYGAFAYRRKRKAQIENSIMGASSPMDASSVFGASGGQNVDTSSSQFQTDFSQGNAGAIDTDEVDPIAEADVYIAYGRDAQAEEILKEALAKDPARHPVAAKLLEIYATRKDAKAFETAAMALQAATGGQGAEWEKAMSLGLSIDPQNALYGGAGAADQAGMDAGAPDIALDGAPDATTAGALDIDFDLGAASDDQAAAAPDIQLDAAPEPAPEQVADAPLDLGFDLGSGGDKPADEKSDFSPEGTLIIDVGSGASETPAAATADAGLDISFDLPSQAEVAPVADAAAPAPDAGGASIDFDLGMDLSAPAATEPAAGEPVATAPLEMDLSSITLDLGTPTEAPAAAGAGDARWQEVATKLDLAKAYEEMGDKDGARDLLKEVLKEGDAAQQQQAQAMLTALG